ncbi:hypothetical protein ACP8HI_19405 [Paenibacillus sp. FA6]|uniref:hypothetical protein n=1 Tax=Paenibacillus sp. FA6 TaxID=3413029 RepID=UPI003F657BA5
MTDVAKILLDARPGILIGTFAKSDDEQPEDNNHEVRISVEVCAPQIQEGILLELRENAHDLYRLLSGETPLWLHDLLPSSTNLMLGEATCHCGDSTCPSLLSVREYASQQLAADPMMRLTLMGLPRKELLLSIFGTWSASTTSQTKEIAIVEASLIEEKEKIGPTPGDWLAEAAEQGRLHEPGPLFRDVTIHLSPPEDSELHADDWTPLLQGVPGVQKALRMILKKTADTAEKRRRTWLKE